VAIDDVTVTNATYGIHLWPGGFSGKARNHHIRRPVIKRAGVGAIALHFIDSGSVVNPRITYAGDDTAWSGTYGIDINYSKDFTFRGGEVAYTLGKVFYAGEGTGVNLNGPNENVRVLGMRLHHNDGPAIAVEAVETAPDRPTYEFSGNRVWDNARANDYPNKDPDQTVYPEFLLLLQLDTKTSAPVRNNWIKVKRNRHLLLVVNSLTEFAYKDDFAADVRVLPGYTFCGNRDLSGSARNPTLIPGNEACR